MTISSCFQKIAVFTTNPLPEEAEVKLTLLICPILSTAYTIHKLLAI
jgi:hypothetical protein